MQIRETDIAIIGAGLTGLTTAYRLARRGKDIHIIEKNNRVGGQIQSFRENGFVFESGPNTGVVSYPEVAELFTDLFPACELETANEDSKRRLIWKGNRFHELPSGLGGGITTPLFTLYDKFRILGEPFRKKGNNPDETVGKLASRRLGKSFLDYAVDPFLSGVYAGDPMALVTRYALPKLYNLEYKYGSFIKGAIAKAREPKTERDQSATKKVFSAKGGLDNLTTALARSIGRENITLSASGVEIQPTGNHWRITYTTPKGEEVIKANKVITTTGAYSLPGLLPFINKEEINKISNLAYAPIVQASVGVNNTKGLVFNAFGGLVPSRENRNVLGILFPSACFKERAPEAGALFSFFIGGVKHTAFITATDEELYRLILDDFYSMLKFPTNIQPDMIRIFRHPQAIPQYEISSGERFDTINKLQLRYSGLVLAGNIRDGIGMADRIKQAAFIADKLII